MSACFNERTLQWAPAIMNDRVLISADFNERTLLKWFILQQGQGEHRFPSGDYDIAMWDQGLRHGPAVYYHSNGSKEECTYVEGYENGPSTVYFAK